MSVPGISCVMSSYLLQAEKGSFYHMFVPNFAMSCPSTYRKANKGAVLCHVLLLIARRTRGGFYGCL